MSRRGNAVERAGFRNEEILALDTLSSTSPLPIIKAPPFPCTNSPEQTPEFIHVEEISYSLDSYEISIGFSNNLIRKKG